MLLYSMSETHNVVSLDGWSTFEAFTRWLALGDRRSLPNHMTLEESMWVRLQVRG